MLVNTPKQSGYPWTNTFLVFLYFGTVSSGQPYTASVAVFTRFWGICVMEHEL